MTDCEGSAMRPVTLLSEPAYEGLANNRSQRTLSDRALELVNGDRQDEYGEPLEHAEKVAATWAAALGWDVDARKFALAMTLLKIVREAHNPKQDSRTDAVGWLEIEQRIVEAS